MSIRNKLLILLGMLTASILFLGFYSILEFKSMYGAYKELGNDRELQIEVKEVQFLLAGLSNDERGLLISKNSEFVQGIATKKKKINDSIANLQNKAVGSEQKEKIAVIKKSFEQYEAASEKVISLYESDNKAALAIHFGEERTIRKESVDPAVNKFTEELAAEIDADNKNYSDEMENTIALFFIMTVAVSLIAAGFGFLTIRSITVPLKNLNAKMGEIAHGEADLTMKIPVQSKDELGQLSQSFNVFLASIRDIVFNVQSSAEQVAAASEQFSASAHQAKSASEHVSVQIQDISVKSNKQRSMADDSLQSLKQALEGLGEITGNTVSLAGVAESVKEEAEKGVSSVQTMVNQMESISESVAGTVGGIQSLADAAGKISTITLLINDIASQTNLLSLNAAIEAARAGEHGKGFAVVAEEVRKLAEQSATAANQINNIVAKIQQEMKVSETSIRSVESDVSSGKEVTREASEKFSTILTSIEDVSSSIQNIAATVQHINTGFEQITSSVDDISAMTAETSDDAESVSAAMQEHLASSEEIEKSAHSLSLLAEEVNGVIGRFKV
ncbi:methyl-accepting chemotaxis protein [Bacillus massilinigeriensis]|uniref:methyl-accepting chemotaxis protein n=1 Tax=Bacillus mediterraneensis TaxID=1805474 RepID=UPI0008F7F392|nr:methyl-accepting chemotaxis protein [Bacillus mediterraneensis]